jgi:hypothetical protein
MIFNVREERPTKTYRQINKHTLVVNLYGKGSLFDSLSCDYMLLRHALTDNTGRGEFHPADLREVDPLFI